MKCKTNTKNIDPRVVETKNKKLLTQSTCSDCKNKKSRFVKKKNKTKKALEKNLTVNLLELILVEKIMMQASKIHTFISNSNKNKIKKLKLQLTNLSVQNNDDNDNINNNNNNNNKIENTV